MKGICLRRFNEQDYPELPRLEKIVFGDFASTEADFREGDANREPHIRFVRFVAETADKQVVGFAFYDQWAGRYHPQKFNVDLVVHPEYEGQGIGRALFAMLEESARPYDPISFQVYVQEEKERGLAFAEKQGFVESRRTFTSELEVPAFDKTPYAGLEESILAEHGIRLIPISELTDDLERDAKLHVLTQHIRRDFPADIPANDETFEHWYKTVMANPRTTPELYQVAVTPEGEYIGYSFVERDEEEPTRYWTKQTGVLPEYRGKHIATALKVKVIEGVREHGRTIIRTSNDSTNAPMLAVNDKLGFKRLPAWIILRKTYR